MTKSAIVVGAGNATGGAIARYIAAQGMPVTIMRRRQEQLSPLAEEIRQRKGTVLAIGADARKENDIKMVFERTQNELGPIGFVIFNIGANVRMPFVDIDVRKFSKIWEMACFAGFLTGREAARYMVPQKQGTIIFTGASASVKGYENGAAFASAKFALRGMAQSMARELGPKGIHVAHSIIDGAVDTAFIRDNFPEHYKLKEKDGIINPEDIAQAYWFIHQQSRTTWTHEIDLRPWMENF